MPEPMEYVTSRTGTVHLAQAATGIPGATQLTLCGRQTDGWEMGDETLSGIAATCGRCRQLAGIGTRR